MAFRERFFLSTLAILIFTAMIFSATTGLLAGPNDKMVDRSAKIYIEFWPAAFQDTFIVAGPCHLNYSDPIPSVLYPGLEEIESDIIFMELTGGLGEIFVRKNPMFPSPGQIFIDPGPDTSWVESFFDVTFEIELPGVAPGQILHTQISPPLTDFIDQYPPFYDNLYIYPSPPVPLYDEGGLEVGLVMYWDERDLPWSEPSAYLHIPTYYGSEIAELDELGRVKLEGSVTDLDIGSFVLVSGSFSFRQCGDPGPFTPLDTDLTPEGQGYATKIPMGTGDGLTAYFEPGSEPFEGQCYEFEFEAEGFPGGFWRDTVLVWVDPIPPVPEIVNVHPDSIVDWHVDSFFDVMYKVDDEMTAPGVATLQALPLQTDWTRPLTPVNQHDMGTANDSMSCAPAAAASCLKYFADNGHSDLDNPEGDESKPDASGTGMANELAGNMGTDSTGTTPAKIVSGIKKYLENHGKSGWEVSDHSVDSATDLAAMLREFESDSEDVLILVKDTTSAGDTIGHVVTMGSSHRTQDPPKQKIDFMDPWGGTGGSENNHDVGKNDAGQPTLEGYDLDGEGGGTGWISGYVKVSPPSGGSSDSPPMIEPLLPSHGSRSFEKAPARVPWLVLDSGVVNGNGIVDTLHLDTSILAPGLHLFEVVTIDDDGFECRDIRLAWIHPSSTGDDEPGPPIRTGLRKSYPNPFNPSTTIEYSLLKDTKVTMVIYDVAGRRVRTLLSDVFTEAGVYKEVWDGKNDRGVRMASGVYFCRFLAADQVEAKKLIMLR